MRVLRLPILAAALSLAGCATMQSGGFTVLQAMTLEAFEAVKGRASFELECPKDKLEPVVLAVVEGSKVPSQIGVTGCGHKAVYVDTPSGWVANTTSDQKK